jgi:hypothetical protein
VATWRIARDEWHEFLDALDRARAEVHCTISNAWFRGHEDAAWTLSPSLFRPAPESLPIDPTEVSALAHKELGLRQNIAKLTALRRGDDPPSDVYTSLKEAQQQQRTVRGRIRVLTNRRMGSDDLKRYEELEAEREDALNRLSDMRAKLSRLGRPASSDLGAEQIRAASAENKVDIGSLREKIRATSAWLDSAKHEMEVLNAVHYGEHEAFVDYTFRSGANHRPSWEVLAEMQHFGVPTRLLDWTEIAVVAIFFAVRRYFPILTKAIAANDLDRRISPQSVELIPDEELAGVPEPTVIVLNPYLLARRAIKVNRILDPSLNVEHDYFNSFFVRRRWPFTAPAPMYSSWRNPRLAAQQGMFTVQGTSREPLETQVPEVLRIVRLTRAAALYAALHVSRYCGLSRFTIYRDLDALGSQVRDAFIHPKPRLG